MENSPVSTNTIAFIGLCSEYCNLLQNAAFSTRGKFIEQIVKLLPRIYIVATDIRATIGVSDYDDGYVDSALDEESYESVRRSLEGLLGEDDSYLEVFEEDMKYSDTPIGASVAEGLSDLFQVFYNFVNTVRDDAADYVVDEALRSVMTDFGTFWGQTLCNIMRPLNHIRFSSIDDDGGDDDDDFTTDADYDDDDDF